MAIKMPFPLFRAQYKSIFISEEYGTIDMIAAPKMLDIGANYGMSCLYFKSRWPDAEIIAYETDLYSKVFFMKIYPTIN